MLDILFDFCHGASVSVVFAARRYCHFVRFSLGTSELLVTGQLNVLLIKINIYSEKEKLWFSCFSWCHCWTEFVTQKAKLSFTKVKFMVFAVNSEMKCSYLLADWRLHSFPFWCNENLCHKFVFLRVSKWKKLSKFVRNAHSASTSTLIMKYFQKIQKQKNQILAFHYQFYGSAENIPTLLN